MKNNIVQREFVQLKKEYEDFGLKKLTDGYQIEGLIGFETHVKGEGFSDQYKIQISIGKDYPSKLPSVKEVGERIERTIENHVNYDDTLCLGVTAEVKKELTSNYTLLEFVEKIVINYLSQYSFKEKHGFWPYGESAHYTEGVLDFYKEEYGLKTYEDVVEFLRELSLAKQRPKGYKRCTCGCGKLIKNCARQKLLKKARIKDYDYQTEVIYAEEFLKGGNNV